MIDISKETNTATPKPVMETGIRRNLSVPLAIALIWVVYDTSYWTKFIPDRIGPSQKSSQILFVTTDDMTSGQGQSSVSQKVDRFCEENDIERRRLEQGQDIVNGEVWLQEMANLGYGQAPCIVFRESSGKLQIIPIPDSVDKTLNEISLRI